MLLKNKNQKEKYCNSTGKFNQKRKRALKQCGGERIENYKKYIVCQREENEIFQHILQCAYIPYIGKLLGGKFIVIRYYYK